MADFTPVATQIQPPQSMSLADMVNLARGAQAYQQAQQLNPLALQKANLEVQQAQQTYQQAQKLNPLAVEKAQQEVSQSKIGTQQKQLELDQSHFNLAGNILSGLESRATQLAKTKDYSTAIKELNAAEQWMNASGVPSQENGPLTLAKQQLQQGDFKGYLSTLENMRNIMAGANNRFQANQPTLTTSGGAPALFTPATQTVTPVTIGNANQKTGTGGGTNTGNQQGVTATQMQLQYPVRRAGDVRPYAPSEPADEAAGTKYRNDLVNAASNQTTSLRNQYEIIKQAHQLGEEEWGGGAGFMGTLGRNVSTFLGTEAGVRYKQLSKDLANAQLSNMRAMGMSTDADKTLQAAANGEYTYPPKILEEIAHRNLADMKNIELQSRGTQAFAKKYGDNNMKTFQDLWSKNARDSRVFEAIAINESDLSKEEKIKKIDDLFHGLSAKDIEKLTQEKNNLLKLSRTGEL